jgi:hypothetical protein
MILAEIVTTLTDESCHNIISKLQYIKLSQYNENVEKAVAVLHANVQRLQSCNAVPPNIKALLLRILQSSNVFKFRNHFAILESTQNPIISDPSKLLLEAVRRYRELKAQDAWFPAGTKLGKQSLFQASDTSDHAPPTTHRGPPPSRGPNNAPGQLRTHDAAGRIIDRTPPTSSQSTTRVDNTGRSEQWCTECGRWGNHLDDGHAQFKENWKNQSFRRKPFQKAKAQIVTNTTTPAMPIPTATQEAAKNTEDIVPDRLRSTILPAANFTMMNF